MVRQKGGKPRLLPSQEPNFYYADATKQILTTHEQGHRAIASPTSSSTTNTSTGQDRGTSSNPLVLAKDVSSPTPMIASSFSTLDSKSSPVFMTTLGAMQKVGKIARAVSAEVSSFSSRIVDDSVITSTILSSDSEIQKMTRMQPSVMVSTMPHVVPDEELHIPKSSCSTPQQEVVVSSSTQNENVWVTEEDVVATTSSTSKGRPLSSVENWTQAYYGETVGNFEGRKFFFVAGCDSLEDCMVISNHSRDISYC
jgi:hypothetical protein